MFSVDEINIKTKRGTISYGALANLRKRRDIFQAQLEGQAPEGKKEEGRPTKP